MFSGFSELVSVMTVEQLSAKVQYTFSVSWLAASCHDVFLCVDIFVKSPQPTAVIQSTCHRTKCYATCCESSHDSHDMSAVLLLLSHLSMLRSA